MRSKAPLGCTILRWQDTGTCADRMVSATDESKPCDVPHTVSAVGRR